jgi:hypothetical protein
MSFSSFSPLSPDEGGIVVENHLKRRKFRRSRLERDCGERAPGAIRCRAITPFWRAIEISEGVG